MKRLVALFVISLLVEGLVVMLITKKHSNQPHGIEIDEIEYPVFGIDLSEYSGKIDFKGLKEEKLIDFVYLRVSAGKDYKDKKFEKNYSEAIQNEFVVGYYHYYRFYEDPKSQADFFLEQISSKESVLPLVVDVEEWGNKTKGKSSGKIANDIEEFIRIVNSKIEKEVIIYTNESGYNTYVKNNIDNIPIWICSFSKKEKVDDKWLFWQFSHKGKLTSIEGWVDFNTFNGDRDKWAKYLKRK